MKKDFAVKSRFASVYNAFIIECEKIGWVWNSEFNKKESVDDYTNFQNACIYFCAHWKEMPNIPAMSFSGSPDTIDLDTNFAGAIEVAKEVFKNVSTRVVPKLTDKYDAIISTKGISVGCKLVTFEKFDELVAKVNEFRK